MYLDRFDSLVIEHSESWINPKHSWRKERTSVGWLKSTIPLQAIFILVFRGIPED